MTYRDLAEWLGNLTDAQLDRPVSVTVFGLHETYTITAVNDNPQNPDDQPTMEI